MVLETRPQRNLPLDAASVTPIAELTLHQGCRSMTENSPVRGAGYKPGSISKAKRSQSHPINGLGYRPRSEY